jgi:hypothetical protein
MPDFSPAAQAIVNAAVEAGGGYGRATPTLHARLAAALRAAVEQSTYQDAWDGQFTSAEKILAIAAELETSITEN